MNSSNSNSNVNSATITNAVSALLKWKEAQQSSTQKLKLIPEDEFIYLILTLKKIPAKPRTNAYKIPLPHPLHSPSSSEICLIIDDRPNSKPSPETVKQIIRAQNLPIAKLIRLSKLKSNYKPFEAKRKLCDSYDLFLVDKRVVHFLPKLIGKSFFKKRKIPVPVDMGKNWKGKVEKVGSCGLLYFRTGTCCVVKVGKGGMERGEIEENVREAVDGVVAVVPKQWGGVRSLHLKFADSVALPLYQALPDLKLRIEGVRKEVEDSEKESDVESLKGDGLVSDRKGLARKKDKGRIHEVRYMDVGLTEFDGDEMNEKEVGDDRLLGKNGGVDDEFNDSDSGDGEAKKAKEGKKGKGVKRQAVQSGDGGELTKKGRKAQKLEGDKLNKVKGTAGDELSDKLGDDAALKKTKKDKLVKRQIMASGDGLEPPKKGRNALEDDKPKKVINKSSKVVVKAKEGSTISTKEKRSKK